jgi:hypothetical protein
MGKPRRKRRRKLRGKRGGLMAARYDPDLKAETIEDLEHLS